jgi:hypothetical protein
MGLRDYATGVKQQIEGIAQSREMASQISAGSITNPEFFDQGGIVQSAVVKL